MSFPGSKILPSSLDAFYAEAEKVKDQLPVTVAGEIGDGKCHESWQLYQLSVHPHTCNQPDDICIILCRLFSVWIQGIGSEYAKCTLPFCVGDPWHLRY